METITLPVNEYNSLIERVKLTEDHDLMKLYEIIKDDVFFNKFKSLYELFNNIENKHHNNNSNSSGIAFTLAGIPLSKAEYQTQIDLTRAEVESGGYITYDELVKELDYE